MSVLDQLQTPDVLGAMATLAALAPPPAGPILAALLKLAEEWIRSGKSIDEVNGILARYSAEAQKLADTWPVAGE